MPQEKNEHIFNWEKMTHTAVKKLDRARTLVVASISPLEVHGPHLPLGQDLFEATALAEKTAAIVTERRPDWTVVLLPPVPVAADTLPQIGSIEFPPGLVRDVAYYLLAPFARQGFSRLAISSFHGGPRHFLSLEQAAARITQKHGVPAVCLFSAALSQIVEGHAIHDGIKDTPGSRISVDQLKQDHHAGFLETSIGLVLWPELIEPGWDELPGLVSDPNTAEKQTNDSYLYGYDSTGTTTEKIQRAKAVIDAIVRSLRHFREKTYHGFPEMASKEQGQALLEYLSDLCAGIVEKFIDRGTGMELHSPLWKYRNLMLNPALNAVADKWLLKR